jgi:uncharacterized protein YpuA (DUF1002 family)
MMMKFTKTIAILAVLKAINLSASSLPDLESISALVKEINYTTDIKEKNKLVEDLNNELLDIDLCDYQTAKALINKRLKFSNNSF